MSDNIEFNDDASYVTQPDLSGENEVTFRGGEYAYVKLDESGKPSYQTVIFPLTDATISDKPENKIILAVAYHNDIAAQEIHYPDAKANITAYFNQDNILEKYEVRTLGDENKEVGTASEIYMSDLGRADNILTDDLSGGWSLNIQTEAGIDFINLISPEGKSALVTFFDIDGAFQIKSNNNQQVEITLRPNGSLERIAPATKTHSKIFETKNIRQKVEIMGGYKINPQQGNKLQY